jgi:hypothetical protein
MHQGWKHRLEDLAYFFRGSTRLSFFSRVPFAKMNTPIVMCSSVVDVACTMGCLTPRGTNTSTLDSDTTPIVSSKFATSADGDCGLCFHHAFNVSNKSSIVSAVRRRSCCKNDEGEMDPIVYERANWFDWARRFQCPICSASLQEVAYWNPPNNKVCSTSLFEDFRSLCLGVS